VHLRNGASRVTVMNEARRSPLARGVLPGTSIRTMAPASRPDSRSGCAMPASSRVVGRPTILTASAERLRAAGSAGVASFQNRKFRAALRRARAIRLALVHDSLPVRRHCGDATLPYPRGSKGPTPSQRPRPMFVFRLDQNGGGRSRLDRRHAPFSTSSSCPDIDLDQTNRSERERCRALPPRPRFFPVMRRKFSNWCGGARSPAGVATPLTVGTRSSRFPTVRDRAILMNMYARQPPAQQRGAHGLGFESWHSRANPAI